MVYAKIYCFDCLGRFDLYADRMTEEQPPVACPHCGAVVPEKAFRKLLNVTGELAEIEKDLRSASDVDGAPLFSIDLNNYHPRQPVRRTKV